MTIIGYEKINKSTEIYRFVDHDSVDHTVNTSLIARGTILSYLKFSFINVGNLLCLVYDS